MLGLAGTSALLFLSAFVGLLFFFKVLPLGSFFGAGKMASGGGGGSAVSTPSLRPHGAVGPASPHPYPILSQNIPLWAM